MALILGLLLIIRLLNIYKKDNNLYYSYNLNDGYYWLIKDDNSSIYEIGFMFNNLIENRTVDLKNYTRNKTEMNYKLYDINKKNDLIFNNISVSENPPETNFLINHKYAYDLNIDSTGNITANVYYPEEKVGGYSFNLSENDFKIFKEIFYNITIDELDRKHFVKDYNSVQSIVINSKYVLNDFEYLNSNLNINAILMFSNYLTMKYIDKQSPDDSKYSIESSKYSKLPIPESW